MIQKKLIILEMYLNKKQKVDNLEYIVQNKLEIDLYRHKMLEQYQAYNKQTRINKLLELLKNLISTIIPK